MKSNLATEEIDFYISDFYSTASDIKISYTFPPRDHSTSVGYAAYNLTGFKKL